MNTAKLIVTGVFFLFLLSSCKEEIKVPEYFFEIEESQLQQDFNKDAVTVKIPVSTNLLSDEWSVSSNADWCLAAQSYTSGENAVTISLFANKEVDARTTTITVKSAVAEYTVMVRQLGEGPSVWVKNRSLTISKDGETFEITVTANVEYEVIEPIDVDWVTKATASSSKKSVIESTHRYTASANSNFEPRIARFYFQSKSDANVVDSCLVLQEAAQSEISEPKDDIKIKPINATCSSYQGGEGIERSYDDNLNTFYHSAYNNTGANYFPITLTYSFGNNVSKIDYIVYHPRAVGTNGNFKEFELWVATKSNPTPTKYGDYDFLGNSFASRIAFNEVIENPTEIRFVVKSGVGGFANCAEMEFYQNNPENFDYLSVFADKACSELKAGVTLDDIKKINDSFFRFIAEKIYAGTYDTSFRVQTYRSYQHPDILAARNKTSTYSLRENATGIYVNSGEELIVFANNFNSTVSLFVQGTDNAFSGTSYILFSGMNRIKVQTTGLAYIMFYTATGTETPVKIHIATGTVNGYFDSAKHTKDDWSRLLSAASYKHFDVLGRYAHLTFETQKFRERTPDGLALISKYDDLVYKEWEFMGLEKYNRLPQGRMYFLGIYDSYMYATAYYTGYESSTQNRLCNLNYFSTTDCWGPAHEVGHCNQTRPGLRWAGMTEVTNNIHSLYIQTLWGNTSRLEAERFYDIAVRNLLNKGIAHNDPALTNVEGSGNHHFVRLVPFWQLKLYLHDVLGKNDFYKDLYERVRNQDDSKISSQGGYQLEFVRNACDVAQLDLTAFFEAWGFLTPINAMIEDYSSSRFTVTEAQINQLKADIAAKNYPKPAHANIYDIRDSNVSSYR